MALIMFVSLIAAFSLLLAQDAFDLATTANNTAANGSTNATDLNSKVNKSGDTITGNIFENRSGASLGSFSYIDLTRLNNPATWGRVVAFYSTNRVYNETSLSWENATYTNRSGAALAFDSQGMSPPTFKVAVFQPNETTYDYVLESSQANLKTPNSTTKIVFTNLSGVGSAYVCVDSNGILYRGGPGC